MSFRVYDAALVGERRIEATRKAERIRGFLNQPPRVFAAAAVVVIAVPQPIHRSNVDRVTPHVLDRPVIAAVAADFRVTVKLAPHELEWFVIIGDALRA